MRKWTGLLSIALLSLWVAALATTPAAAGKDNVFEGRWLSSTAGDLEMLPEGREGYCVAFSGADTAEPSGLLVPRERIYMTHGNTSFGDTGHVRAYDIPTDTWISLTSSVNPRAEGVGVGHDGLVYCLGGRYLGSALPLVEVYDPTLDFWTELSSMNFARAGLSAAVIGDKIFAIGGRSATGGPCSGNPLDVAEVYDISLGVWSPITSPLIPVTDAVAVAKGGDLFLFGGCTAASTPTNAVQIYDRTSDTWTLGPVMPTPRASLAAEALGNTIYVIGGLDFSTGNLNVVEPFDVDKMVWSGPCAEKTTSCSEMFAVPHGGKLYIPGSGSFGTTSRIFEIFKKK